MNAKMRVTIRRLKKRFFDIDNVNGSFRLLLFNIIALVGTFGSLAGLVIVLITDSAMMKIPANVAVILFLVYFFYLANWKNRVKTAETGIVLMLTLFIIPSIFFSSGGAYGGTASWFILCLVSNFLLIEGIEFVVLFVIQVALIIVFYCVAYFYPQFVINIKSAPRMYVDVVYSIFVAAYIIGCIHKFHKAVYNRAMKKISEQNSELSESEKKADAANKAKSEFLSNMSHEIRTPINAIIGMNEMILHEADDEKILEYAEAVDVSSNMLLSLINDILDFSKIEAGKIEIVNTNYQLSSVLVDCIDMIMGRLKSKGLNFVVRCSETIPNEFSGDVIRVRQILYNILTNAVKYTEEGSVELLVEGVRKDNNIFFLTVSVKDTGIGMTEESLKKIFSKFERFDMERNRNIEGTGLGLSIVKGLVDNMGGEIKVTSEYGKGSEFTITLPQQIVDNTPMGPFDSGIKQKQRKEKESAKEFVAPEASILVVDDVTMNLKVFLNLLKKTKISVDTAESGKESIEKVRQKKYDIVFIDHMMPGMDGIETFHAMQTLSDNKNSETPIIMLTANAQSGSEEMYKSEGFSDYLSKPIRGADLGDMVRKYLPKNKIQYMVKQ